MASLSPRTMMMTAVAPLLTTAFLVAMSTHNVATAWLSTTRSRNSRHVLFMPGSSLGLSSGLFRPQKKNGALFYRNDQDDPSVEQPVSLLRRRASLAGVSLSPTGFWTMLRVAQDVYVPWQVTEDPLDAISATSPEALTLLQLLSGVDMAGAILPPDVLAKLIVYHCESLVDKYKVSTDRLFLATKQVTLAEEILAFVQETLPNATVAYSQVPSWVQSRVILPQASLDEVHVTTTKRPGGAAPFALTCTVRNFGSLTFCPSAQALEAVLYQYSPKTSLAFTCLALALRYHAPITTTVIGTAPTTTTPSSSLSLQDLEEQFPLYATVANLQQSSHRVQHNIVRGFEIHKLTGALQIARTKGDVAAAAKIRQALDQYDSMDQLPTGSLQEEGLLQQPPPPLMDRLSNEKGQGGDLSPQNNITLSVLQ